jgi:hypothetical protein
MGDFSFFIVLILFLLGVLFLIIVPALLLELYILKKENEKLKSMIKFFLVDDEYDIKNKNKLSEKNNDEAKDKEELDH